MDIHAYSTPSLAHQKINKSSINYQKEYIKRMNDMEIIQMIKKYYQDKRVI